MSELLTALAWLVAGNVWLALGAAVLVVAINRSVVPRPDNVIHSIIQMALWPLLLLRGLWFLCKRLISPATRPATREP